MGRHTSGVLLRIAATIVATAVTPAFPTEPLVESSKVRLVTARVRIEPAYDNAPDCRQLGADDLKVSLRGERLPDGWTVRLDREPVPAVHALLVDTSGSMYGRMAYAREAATRYVRRLPSRDQVMLLGFDESVVLEHGMSGDFDDVVSSIDRLRMGGSTSLHDALYFAFREMDQNFERPVVVLLTDGVDVGSFYERADINALAEHRRDMIVFVVGLAVPQISRNLPSTKRFLQRLAARTDGKYFDAHTAGQLAGVYDRIREALDNEAVITFADPDPGAPPGQLDVSSRVGGCRVRVYRSLEPTDPAGTASVIVRGDRVQMTPDRVYLRFYTPQRPGALLSACSSATDPPEPLWFAEPAAGRLDMCALDITMETGMLYTADDTSRVMSNGYLELTTRPFAVAAPAPVELPSRPEQLLDALAREAVERADVSVKTDPRQVPVEAHARPYRDMNGLIHGRVVHDLRNMVARALWLQPDYRRWAEQRFAEEAQVQLARLRERLRQVAPQTPDAVLDRIARESPAGQEILERAAHPQDRDLGRRLFAWLGDVSAHDLLLRWEALWVDRLLASGGEPTRGQALEAWQALHRLFFVPSYARTLTLFSLVRDDDNGRIGFWRVVLPRPAWMSNRIKGWKNREAYSDLPMDLLPDRPFAFFFLQELRREHPRLVEHLVTNGYRHAGVRYTLPEPARRQAPETAYESLEAELALAAPSGGRLTLAWDVDWKKKEGEPRVTAIRVDVSGDVLAERLSRDLTGLSAPRATARASSPPAGCP
jgi:hypothetical protein